MSLLTYTLTRKNVKNINLRIRRDGSIAASAPYHVDRSQIEAYVSRKRPWINSVLQRIHQSKNLAWPDVSTITTAMCVRRFTPVLNHMLTQLGQHKPISLRVRTCKSRWGSCQPKTRVIMLNRALYFAPMRLLEYVVLHECVHLLVSNHQREFHTLMQRYMPDYTARRKELRQVPLGIQGDL